MKQLRGIASTDFRLHPFDAAFLLFQKPDNIPEVPLLRLDSLRLVTHYQISRDIYEPLIRFDSRFVSIACAIGPWDGDRVWRGRSERIRVSVIETPSKLLCGIVCGHV